MQSVVSRYSFRLIKHSLYVCLMGISAALITFIALTITTPAVRADSLFSNFGPDNSYDSGSNYFISGPDSFIKYHSLAAPFRLTAPALLTSVDLPMDYSNGEDIFTASIVPDNGNTPSDNIVLNTAAIIVPLPGGIQKIVTGTFAESEMLSADTQYWLILVPSANDTLGDWYANSLHQTGLAENVPGSTTRWEYHDYTTPAFRINGIVVPEEASVILFIFTLPMLNTVIRRHIAKAI